MEKRRKNSRGRDKNGVMGGTIHGDIDCHIVYSAGTSLGVETGVRISRDVYSLESLI